MNLLTYNFHHIETLLKYGHVRLSYSLMTMVSVGLLIFILFLILYALRKRKKVKLFKDYLTNEEKKMIVDFLLG